MKIQKSAAAIAATAVLLAACGGGGGGSASAPAAGNPTANIATAGTISGLGSVIVNGVRYETVGSSVIDADDQGAIKTPLGIGMTVEIESNGTDPVTNFQRAGKIHVRGGIKGVASVGNGALSVAGLPVTTDAGTLLLASNGMTATLEQLQGQFVEVYGLPQADGSFVATRIEIESGVEPVRLVGTVLSVNETAKTLQLGTAAQPVTVSYAGSVPGLVAGAVVAVEVSGTAGSYSATRLRVRSTNAQTYTTQTVNAQTYSSRSGYFGTSGKDSERNELYGVISDKAASGAGCTFKVQGIPVQAGSATLCAGIADGNYVEAKGGLVNGVLNATRIEFEGYKQASGYSDDQDDSDHDGLRYRSLTPATSSGSTTAAPTRSFEIYGKLSCSALNTGCTLQSGTVSYQADLSTAYWEHGQIVSGFVEAKGYLSGNNSFKVVKIEPKNSRYGD